MYVCICNGHRDQELRDAAANGIRCALQAYDCLGGAPRCGQCLDMAQQIIDEMHGEAALTVSAMTGQAA